MRRVPRGHPDRRRSRLKTTNHANPWVRPSMAAVAVVDLIKVYGAGHTAVRARPPGHRPAAVGIRVAAGGRCGRSPGRRWEGEPEGRPPPVLALGPDLAAVPFHRAVHGGQADAGAG